MLLDHWHHVTQFNMVVEQSNHLLQSCDLHNQCACAHGLRVYRDHVEANQRLALPLTNHI
jgi:hypothetical protein